MEEISYVDAWAVRDEKVTRQSDSDKSQKNDLKEEKSRHEELLAKIVLATEFEDYSLCRIDDFFYYSLADENETMVCYIFDTASWLIRPKCQFAILKKVILCTV